MEVLGIDIGGSGIKGAPVDIQTGALLAPRYRVATPKPSKPQLVARVVADIAAHFSWQGLIGCGFPGVTRNGVIGMATNMHPKWEGVNAVELFSGASGCRTCVINDADAAGLAEITFGAGRDRRGVVIVVTVGTGIGTAIFVNGTLVPNTEFGNLEIDGKNAEALASDTARRSERLSWKKWGKRFNRFLNRMEILFWPDLFIVGGGVSPQFQKFVTYLTPQAEVLPAQFLNEAGIVGAALSACSSFT